MSYNEIREIALANVASDKPDMDYLYRKVCRFYSKEFSTPLHEVLNLSPHMVFLNFFENYFESMDEESRQDEINRLLNPDLDEEQDLEEFIDMIEEEERSKGKLKPKNNAEQQSSDRAPKKVASKQVAVSRKFDDEEPPPDAGQGLDDLG